MKANTQWIHSFVNLPFNTHLSVKKLLGILFYTFELFTGSKVMKKSLQNCLHHGFNNSVLPLFLLMKLMLRPGRSPSLKPSYVT